MILAGDLGGTKSNLGLFDVKAGKLVRVNEKRYATQKHSGLEEIAADFLNGAKAQGDGGVVRNCRAGGEQSRSSDEFSVDRGRGGGGGTSASAARAVDQ